MIQIQLNLKRIDLLNLNKLPSVGEITFYQIKNPKFFKLKQKKLKIYAVKSFSNNQKYSDNIFVAVQCFRDRNCQFTMLFICHSIYDIQIVAHQIAYTMDPRFKQWKLMNWNFKFFFVTDIFHTIIRFELDFTGTKHLHKSRTPSN